jgi:hypothetical protein
LSGCLGAFRIGDKEEGEVGRQLLSQVYLQCKSQSLLYSGNDYLDLCDIFIFHPRNRFFFFEET